MNNLVKKLYTDGNLVGLKTRPARALIGWMDEREAQILLGIPLNPGEPSPEHVQRVQEAHAAVRSRPAGIEQTEALSYVGEELREYLTEFQQHPICKQYIANGWTIRMANLNQICPLQPIVHLDYIDHSDHFKKLLQHAVQEDILSIVRITLPIPAPIELPMQFDQRKNAWVLQSRNPDARIVAHFSSRVELAPGLFGMGYGFCIALPPSLVQVVLYRGRYFLKDGYHRSLALLEKGIAHIPVLFHEIPQSQDLKVEGRFPDETILGAHPPLFPDYLREDVAAVVTHLAFQKEIMIQSTENQTWGEF
jgi:hypothetical protein